MALFANKYSPWAHFPVPASPHYVVKVFSYEPEMMMMRWKAVLGKTKQARLGLRINSQTVGKSLSVPNTGWLGPKYYVSSTLQLCSLRPPPAAAVLLQSLCIMMFGAQNCNCKYKY